MGNGKAKRYILVGATGDLHTNSLLDFPASPRSFTLGTLAFRGASASMASGTLSGLRRVIASTRSTKTDMKVVRSLNEDGPKLVEMNPADALALRAAKPGVKVIEEVFYRLALFDPLASRRSRRVTGGHLLAVATRSQASKIITIYVLDHQQKPVVDAEVIAFWDLDADEKNVGTTGKDGRVKLRVRGGIERLYIRPRYGYWSRTLKNLAIKTGQEIKVVLAPLDLQFLDARNYFYRATPIDTQSGKKVRVAVIDGGIGPHPDLEVSDGSNFTGTEPQHEYTDNGIGHGTHVAGIIAGRGDGKTGMRGLAPAIELLSYRVCPKDDDEISSFALGTAIQQAVTKGCHLINLSASLEDSEEFVESYAKEAWKQGCLIVAAVGNDCQQSVGFPAALATVIGVSAFGRKRTFPRDAGEMELVAKPMGSDKQDFFASFSNIGEGVDFTAPGVGIISTFPGGNYAVMSGTSMACPIVTGMAARLLSQHEEILKQAPSAERSEVMAKLLFSQAKTLGFGPTYEGYGLCGTK